MPARVIRDAGAKMQLGELLAKYQATANILGRKQIVREVFRKTGKRVPLAQSSRLHVRFDDELLDEVTGGFSVRLPATAAAAHLRQLTPVTRATYDGLSAQYQRDAFTVAGTSDLRLIQKIRDELADVTEKGGTKEEFDQAVAKLTSEAGVEQLNAFTLDTVFQTNMQKAYALGRYEQQMDPDTLLALPYGQYLTVGDDRVRPEHACLDGFVAKMEDPVWRKIYPPNGFNCRCMRVGILKEELPDDTDADEPGYSRLPPLALLKVPQPGFNKVFA